MGHSVEIRVPFVDIEFLKQIAPMLSRPDAPSKRDMAAAASTLMTPEVLDRPKTGFQIPVREWMMEDNRSARDRGLRGWARHVYRRFGGSHLVVRGERSAVSDQKSDFGKDSHVEIRDSQFEGSSPLPSAKRILVFRIGQLGDTIVSLPAMRVVRKTFPKAHIALLCDRHPGKSYVIASDLLRGSGIFDDFLSYPVLEGSDLIRSGRMAALAASIRARGFDTLVYLAPTGRKPEQVTRDYRFFKMAGIRNFIGMRGFQALQAQETGVPLRESPRESELLLLRLAASGLEIAPEDQRSMELGLGADDEKRVGSWLSDLPNDGGRAWIAVGPGSKMPAKRWPLRRFESVIGNLISEFDIWPVVFGGPEDKVIGDWLLEKWGRGCNAAGALNIRSSLSAMKRCRLFIGNDTGTMHMAAAVGLPCVAIFSSRERPGLWYPEGEGHRIFRTTIECEGCGLVECLERGNECINRVTSDDILDACREMLARQSVASASNSKKSGCGVGFLSAAKT
jgi:ADP-heptose:LPS heptosyltransferase